MLGFPKEYRTDRVEPKTHAWTMSRDTSISKQRRRWRVFYTQPRAEKRCEERLIERRIDVFLPKRVVRRQWKDRKKKVVEPLFRNYIFAHVDEAERLRVLQTQGIVRCVSFGGAVAEVPADEVSQIKLTQKEPERLDVVDFPLPPPGAEVLVETGPLEGLRGEVIEHRGQAYLVVRIHAIQQALRINLPAEWVRVESGAALRSA